MLKLARGAAPLIEICLFSGKLRHRRMQMNRRGKMMIKMIIWPGGARGARRRAQKVARAQIIWLGVGQIYRFVWLANQFGPGRLVARPAPVVFVS